MKIAENMRFYWRSIWAWASSQQLTDLHRIWNLGLSESPEAKINHSKPSPTFSIWKSEFQWSCVDLQKKGNWMWGSTSMEWFGMDLKDLPFRWYLGSENGAGLQKSKLKPVFCWQAVLCKTKIPIKPALPAAGNLHIQFLTQVPLLFLAAPAPSVCGLWEIFTASTQSLSSPQHVRLQLCLLQCFLL